MENLTNPTYIKIIFLIIATPLAALCVRVLIDKAILAIARKVKGKAEK